MATPNIKNSSYAKTKPAKAAPVKATVHLALVVSTKTTKAHVITKVS